MSYPVTPPINVRFTDEALQTASHIKMLILREGGKNSFLVTEMELNPLSGSRKGTVSLKMSKYPLKRDWFCGSLLEPI